LAQGVPYSIGVVPLPRAEMTRFILPLKQLVVYNSNLEGQSDR
jgi:hypothetical protein